MKLCTLLTRGESLTYMYKLVHIYEIKLSVT